MFCFHMNEIAAIEIIAAILCAAFIIMKGIPAIGKTARNVKTILCPRCMFITAQMNTILSIEQPLGIEQFISTTHYESLSDRSIIYCNVFMGY